MGIIKEIIIMIKYFIVSKLNKLKGDKNLNQLIDEGLYVDVQKLSSEEVSKLRNEIDRYMEVAPNKWSDEVGSDERIYGVEDISEIIPNTIPIEFYKKVGEQYLGSKIEDYIILAARMNYVEGNKGSGGGWHRDSPFAHQFKTIFYLTDVESSNGPFQYIKTSHLSRYKIKNFNFSKFRFSEEDVSNMKGGELVECVAPAGSACVANTRIIHRGKPIEAGHRYALTIYFFEKAAHRQNFKNLLQQ